MTTIINPLKIKAADLPLVILVDNANNFVSWAIKWFSKGIYNHAMTMTKLGYVDTQDPTGFHRRPMSSYIKKKFKLKFWKIKDIDKAEMEQIYLRTNWALRCGSPYDFVGITGQLLASITKLEFFKKLNNPYTHFCSEKVAKILKGIVDLPPQPSPEDLNEYFWKSERMEVLGYWIHS